MMLKIGRENEKLYNSKQADTDVATLLLGLSDIAADVDLRAGATEIKHARLNGNF